MDFRLSERETKTTMNIFADHAGLIIDPFGIGLSNRNKITSDMYGIRLSPKQSPVYQLMVNSTFSSYRDEFFFSFSRFMVQH